MKIKDIKIGTLDPKEQEIRKIFRENLKEIISKLKDIDLDLYNVNSFLYSTKRIVSALQFFHKRCEIDKKLPHEMIIHIDKKPKEGQVVYVDLGRGFPKEIFDGHWCYILKDFGIKYIVIPLTSIKDNSKANPNFEIDIKIKNFQKNDELSRLHVDDIKVIDRQRVDTRENFYDLVTNTDYILSEINRILLGYNPQTVNIFHGNVYYNKE